MKDVLGTVAKRLGLGPVLSTGNINTLFSLFQQVKKDINDTVKPWNTP